MKVFLLKAGEVRFRYKVFAPLLDFDEPGFLFFFLSLFFFQIY